jgi:nicotinate-nucleotide pyrophosphorylase (carboxylating)
MTVVVDPVETDRIVEAALREDLGELGDVTTDAVIPADAQASARIIAREELVLAGLPVAEAVFARLDSRLAWVPVRRDGDLVGPDEIVARVRGTAAPILRGERVALNCLMRMSGIATAARAAVDEIASTGTTVLDTRKTAPGLRHLDKYAVAVGGATNHRIGLFDAVMVKDTHVAVAGSVGAAVRRARAAGHPPERITAEVRDVDQLGEAIAAGAGRALLDNMTIERMRECVAFAQGRIVLEASGGLRPGRLLDVASTGVDALSLGWLTHSAAAADLSMEIDVSA